MKFTSPESEIHLRIGNRVRIFRSGKFNLTIENYWRVHFFKKLLYNNLTGLRGIILGPIGFSFEIQLT